MTLNGKQSLACLALLSGESIINAAKSAGVGESTLHRWLEDKAGAFAGELDARRKELLRVTFNRLVGSMGKAVDRLVAELDNPESPPAVRVSAADKLLGRALGFSDAIDGRDLWYESQALMKEILADRPEVDCSSSHRFPEPRDDRRPW